MIAGLRREGTPARPLAVNAALAQAANLMLHAQIA
jgi:hypothetical protein